MSSWRKLLGWSLGILVFQGILAPVVAIKGVKPDLVFLFVLYLALYGYPTVAMLCGFALGLLQDTVQVNPFFGMSGLILVMAAFFPPLIRDRLFLASMGAQLLFVTIFSIGGDLVRTFCYLFYAHEVANGFFTRSGLHLFWNGSICLVLFPLWRRWLPMDEALRDSEKRRKKSLMRMMR